MCAMSVRIACRENFAVVDRTRGFCAGHEIARTYELVVTGRVFKIFSGNAGAVPVNRWFEDQYIFALLEAPAEPLPKEGIFGPVTLALAGLVCFGVLERRMLGRDAAIDDADDNVFTVEARRAAQPFVAGKKLKKIKAIVSRERADFIFPDVQYLRQAFEFVRLCGMHFGCETVQTEAKTVNELGA